MYHVKYIYLLLTKKYGRSWFEHEIQGQKDIELKEAEEILIIIVDLSLALVSTQAHLPDGRSENKNCP